MRTTEKKLVDGDRVEVPVMRLKPNDVAILIDRLMVLFDRPSHIGESRGLTVTSELSVDALSDVLERTRGRAGPSRTDVSPVPRRRRLDDRALPVDT
jgi:hypothetical protein